MTQRSMFWSDNTGHGGPYAQDTLRLLFKTMTGNPPASYGVFASQLNNLTTTVASTDSLTIQSGRAVVDGTIYENDASLTRSAGGTPSAGTTGRLLVLRKNWAAQTITVEVVSSTDGVATIPSLTQTDGVTWEIPLYSFTIATSGVVTLVNDLRQMLYMGYSTNAYAKALLVSSRTILIDDDFAMLPVLNTLESDRIFLRTVSSGGTTTRVDGGAFEMTTSITTSDYEATMTSQTPLVKPSQNPRFIWIGVPGAGSARLAAQFYGLRDTAATTATVVPASQHTVGLYSTTTGQLQFYTSGASAATTTNLGTAPTAYTVYRIETMDAGASWHCYENETLVASHTTNVPGSSTPLYAFLGANGNAAAAPATTWKCDAVFLDCDRL